MQSLLRFRYPIIIFLIGLVVTLFGATKKIMHHESADTFLSIGMGLECAAVLSAAVVFFIVTKKRT